MQNREAVANDLFPRNPFGEDELGNTADDGGGLGCEFYFGIVKFGLKFTINCKWAIVNCRR